MNNMARGFTTLMITTVVLSLTLASALTIAQIGLVGAKDDKIRTNRLQAEHSAHARGEVELLAIRDRWEPFGEHFGRSGIMFVYSN